MSLCVPKIPVFEKPVPFLHSPSLWKKVLLLRAKWCTIRVAPLFSAQSPFR